MRAPSLPTKASSQAAFSLLRLHTWAARFGATPRSGRRQRHLLCTGWCTSRDIPPSWWWMRSTGGRWSCRSNAAASWPPKRIFPVPTSICCRFARNNPLRIRAELGGSIRGFRPTKLRSSAKIRPRGVLVNRELKAGLVDWGLSDVLMAVGPLGGILRDGVRQLMAKSAAFDPNAAEADPSGSGGIGKYDWKSQLSQRQYAGPGVHRRDAQPGQLSALQYAQPGVRQRGWARSLSAADAARKTAEENAMRYIFERTSLMYFFANQLEMLEITNLESAPEPLNDCIEIARAWRRLRWFQPSPAANFRSLVNRWKGYQASFQAACIQATRRAGRRFR